MRKICCPLSHKYMRSEYTSNLRCTAKCVKVSQISKDLCKCVQTFRAVLWRDKYWWNGKFQIMSQRIILDKFM
jgi:hypothetical protein